MEETCKSQKVKTCRVCSVEKAVEAFSIRSKAKGTRRTECKACLNSLRKSQPSFGKWHKANRAYIQKYNKEYSLKRVWGLSQFTYDNFLLLQNGKCAICGTNEFMGRGKRAHVDHCHKTGRIRGLLCNLCNVGLGSFKEDPRALERAIHYVLEHWPDDYYIEKERDKK